MKLYTKTFVETSPPLSLWITLLFLLCVLLVFFKIPASRYIYTRSSKHWSAPCVFPLNRSWTSTHINREKRSPFLFPSPEWPIVETSHLVQGSQALDGHLDCFQSPVIHPGFWSDPGQVHVNVSPHPPPSTQTEIECQHPQPSLRSLVSHSQPVNHWHPGHTHVYPNWTRETRNGTGSTPCFWCMPFLTSLRIPLPLLPKGLFQVSPDTLGAEQPRAPFSVNVRHVYSSCHLLPLFAPSPWSLWHRALVSSCPSGRRWEDCLWRRFSIKGEKKGTVLAKEEHLENCLWRERSWCAVRMF